MTIYNFEVEEGALRIWDDSLRTERFSRKVYLRRIFGKIYIITDNIRVNYLSIGDIGTIDGVVPNDLDDALSMLNVLVKQVSESGGGGVVPAGASTESKQDQQITAANAANTKLDSQTALLTSQNNILGSQGANPPTISGTGILGYLRGLFDVVYNDLIFKNTAESQAIQTDDVVETDNNNLIYALKGMKKLASSANNQVRITNISVGNDQSNDSCVIMLLKNPTYNNAPTYTASGLIEYSNQENRIITNKGEELAAITCYRQNQIQLNVLMTGTDDYVLAVKPLSGGQDNFGTINIKFL